MNSTALPYEILQTAYELYAGKTGFNQAEMKTFFSEEVMKYRQSLVSFNGGESGWARFFWALAQVGDISMPPTFPTRAKALEYWLSRLPLAQQKKLLLELCRKPNFPMSMGNPLKEQRERLARLLNNFVIEERVFLALQAFDSDHIKREWAKAIERCAADPEGAITSARTLLESTCKHILEKRRSAYDERADLPTLYSQVARELRIAPNQQTEAIFRRIFGGCQTVVVGLGSLRNHLSDAHGRGMERAAPAPRHAELAVNLAGATALFLIETLEEDLLITVPAGSRLVW